jgi:hypothetical protein
MMMAGGNGELSEAGVSDVAPRCDRTAVAVIIPAFNQARFLADAIMSVLAQTRRADEIIVVDDGSTDDPASVVAGFKNVRLITQRDNRGPSAARNVGLRSCNACYVVFLDADDRLLPTAIEAGLACMARRPDCAFVFGGYRIISENGNAVGSDCFAVTEEDAHLWFLRGNSIPMPASVLFRRDCLSEVNGFDEAFRHCEDYDLYLRIAQKFPVASHAEIVAEYRRHGQNASGNLRKMYLAGHIVLDRHKVRIASDATALAVLEQRRVTRRGYYARQMIYAATADWRARRNIGSALLNVAQAARLTPFLTPLLLLRVLGRSAINRVREKSQDFQRVGTQQKTLR